ncbi:hypothetical protein BRADI_2g03910v3 [Brachypodium distachyon]|uniref:Leucine-rich repeat-containing N-terminal plant-type domain-containing protein n=1 Tax=Brachypodium distachyon TaxID=15368 RepID=I1HC96_BRADI|nr:hypothetical protein BRADI_2g03910v3 [Brachypodium distachyon]
MDKEGDNVSPSLSNINSLYLSSCNLTKIPGALRYLDNVVYLDLSSNKINGVIPSWVWENWKDQLISLNLSNNMFTILEKSPSLVHMPQLELLDLSFNRLEGNIPVPVTNVEAILDYSNNNFSSIEPDFGKYVTNSIYLDLSKNKLNGHLPSSICSAKQLDMLDLSYNNFSGSVPSCLIESGELSTLKLRENQLHGMLPENIQEGGMFQTIDLNGNQFEGKLPRSLSNCQDLVLLDVGNNWIVDSFPSWLGVLPQLRVPILSSNQFNGTIRNTKGDGPSINNFTSLQILDLASNNFCGNLPKGWFNELKAMMGNGNDQGQVLGHATNFSTRFYQDTVSITFKGLELSFTKMLSTFKAIDFSNNSFDGPIPESIGRLVSLHGLNLSHNNFAGQIPSQFSNFSQLEALDLSWNKLSGEIPQDLTSLTSLEWLDLSYNNLSGRIPRGNQFLTFSNGSFEGNVGLCGLPLSKQCSTPPSISPSAASPPESNSLWQDKLGAILLFAFVGLGFGVGFALSLVLRLRWRIEGWLCKH